MQKHKMPNRQISFPALEKDQTWRLGLLVAPPGSGKTRYLRIWAKQQHQKFGIAIAWLTLRHRHNRPDCFWADLCASFEQAGIQSLPGHAPSISNNDPVGLEEKIVEIANTLINSPHAIIAILDGYDAIRSNLIHQALVLLIDSLPPQAQILIAARTNPPLQQARLRVRRQLVELGPADLGYLAG
jgi:LuxR family transcriptional regulator, maltose regulon positive regulatory protein